MNKPVGLEIEHLSTGSLFGNHGGGAPLLYKETLFIGTPGDMIKKALKMGISLHRSPAGELGAGEYLPGTMRDV
jgi:hypothetical protein